MENYKHRKNETRIPSKGDFLESYSGSVCVVSHVDHDYVIEIVGVIWGELTYEEDGAFFDELKNMYPASGKAIAKLNSTLYESGKVYNPVTMQVEDIEQEFKRGDVIYCEDNDGFNWVFILKERMNRESNPYTYFCSLTSTGVIVISDCCRHPDLIFRHATPREAQSLWDALAKEGKRWNHETMQVEEIKNEIPRAKVGGTYWSFDYSDFRVFSCEENGHIMDITRYKQGRYFLSEKQAQRAADKLKQALADFWKEELK